MGFGRRKNPTIQYELSSIFLDTQHFSSFTEILTVDNSNEACEKFSKDKIRCINIERNALNDACIKYVHVQRNSDLYDDFHNKLPSMNLKEILMTISESGILPSPSGYYERIDANLVGLLKKLNYYKLET
jgi:hypothetical protein